MSFAQTLMHYKLGHHPMGGKFFLNHINFHHVHYCKDHLVSRTYLDDEGNNTPFFFIPVLLVGACTYLVLPVDLFLAQLVACAASFYAHVFFDKEYHIEGSRLQRFAWFRRKQELHFVHHRRELHGKGGPDVVRARLRRFQRRRHERHDHAQCFERRTAGLGHRQQSIHRFRFHGHDRAGVEGVRLRRFQRRRHDRHDLAQFQYGGLELYDIANNQITNSFFLGTIGLDWRFAGIAPIHAAGASDLVLRNINTGQFEVYDIANNHITGAHSWARSVWIGSSAASRSIRPPVHGHLRRLNLPTRAGDGWFWWW
jgi:hypothetical protein